MNEEIQNSRETLLQEKEKKMIEAYQYDDYLQYSLAYSKVLFRDIYRLKEEITIYKGANDHLQKNYLVVNQKGLVGVITKVYKNRSVVQLLPNKNTRLSVKINDEYGLLKAKDNQLIVEGIDNKKNIAIGSLVYTSDLSIYPENILVGKVTGIHYDKYEIEQILTIESEVNFDQLSYLAVITNLRGEQ